MPTRPLLIYDGDCSFCKRWITRWQHMTGGAIDYEPSQTAAERFPQIPREEFGKSVWLVEPDGMISRSAEAVFRTLALAGQKRYLQWLYRRVPPLRWTSELLYRFIARHRDPIDKLDRIVIGTETTPSTYSLTRSLFLRLLGVVYLIALISLFVQIDGLIGSNGILPAKTFLGNLDRALGPQKYSLLPTLAWISSSDQFLRGLCIAGFIASGMLIVGIVPLLSSVALWAIYLSLSIVCQDFLAFQWDILLLEVGFLAIFWSPPLWAGTGNARPSRLVHFMLKWLLFRLMFLSALVKWFSGDDSWRNMTALRFHFESQPLPTWTSWYAHHSPNWILAVGCFFMFVSEALIPFLYFAPRRTRMLAFWLTILLQVSIMASGNYGYFNLLTMVLALVLLDDSAIARMFRRAPIVRQARGPLIRPWVVAPLMMAIFVITIIEGVNRLTYRNPIKWPTPIATFHSWFQPFRIANAYGLFEVMTKGRPELIIEGSDDGVNWKEYAFKYKPGDVMQRPRFAIGHMPRLDWQIWWPFLQGRQMPAWFQNFAYRLLTNQPEVLKLMAGNPFPDAPPRYIRAGLYDYEFTKPKERAKTGAWWTRKPRALYLPPISLTRSPVEESFRL